MIKIWKKKGITDIPGKIKETTRQNIHQTEDIFFPKPTLFSSPFSFAPRRPSLPKENRAVQLLLHRSPTAPLLRTAGRLSTTQIAGDPPAPPAQRFSLSPLSLFCSLSPALLGLYRPSSVVVRHPSPPFVTQTPPPPTSYHQHLHLLLLDSSSNWVEGMKTLTPPDSIFEC